MQFLQIKKKELWEGETKTVGKKTLHLEKREIHPPNRQTKELHFPQDSEEVFNVIFSMPFCFQLSLRGRPKRGLCSSFSSV